MPAQQPWPARGPWSLQPRIAHHRPESYTGAMARKSGKNGVFRRTDIAMITILALIALGVLIFGGVIILLLLTF